tara:strand:- start:36 stop:458 length:423 start_codon:yes stop_codon:yes gene_type:complete
MFSYDKAAKNTGEGTFWNPSQASRDSAKNFLDVFTQARGGFQQGKYAQQGAASLDPYRSLANKPFGGGRSSGRSETLADGSLTALYPDSYEPIVFPGVGGGPQGRSTTSRLAGAATGALSGFAAGGPVGAVVGGLGGLFG